MKFRSLVVSVTFAASLLCFLILAIAFIVFSVTSMDITRDIAEKTLDEAFQYVSYVDTRQLEVSDAVVTHNSIYLCAHALRTAVLRAGDLMDGVERVLRSAALTASRQDVPLTNLSAIFTAVEILHVARLNSAVSPQFPIFGVYAGTDVTPVDSVLTGYSSAVSPRVSFSLGANPYGVVIGNYSRPVFGNLLRPNSPERRDPELLIASFALTSTTSGPLAPPPRLVPGTECGRLCNLPVYPAVSYPADTAYYPPGKVVWSVPVVTLEDEVGFMGFLRPFSHGCETGAHCGLFFVSVQSPSICAFLNDTRPTNGSIVFLVDAGTQLLLASSDLPSAVIEGASGRAIVPPAANSKSAVVAAVSQSIRNFSAIPPNQLIRLTANDADYFMMAQALPFQLAHGQPLMAVACVPVSDLLGEVVAARESLTGELKRAFLAALDDNEADWRRASLKLQYELGVTLAVPFVTLLLVLAVAFVLMTKAIRPFSDIGAALRHVALLDIEALTLALDDASRNGPQVLEAARLTDALRQMASALEDYRRFLPGRSGGELQPQVADGRGGHTAVAMEPGQRNFSLLRAGVSGHVVSQPRPHSVVLCVVRFPDALSLEEVRGGLHRVLMGASRAVAASFLRFGSPNWNVLCASPFHRDLFSFSLHWEGRSHVDVAMASALCVHTALRRMVSESTDWMAEVKYGMSVAAGTGVFGVVGTDTKRWMVPFSTAERGAYQLALHSLAIGVPVLTGISNLAGVVVVPADVVRSVSPSGVTQVRAVYHPTHILSSSEFAQAITVADGAPVCEPVGDASFLSYAFSALTSGPPAANTVSLLVQTQTPDPIERPAEVLRHVAAQAARYASGEWVEPYSVALPTVVHDLWPVETS